MSDELKPVPVIQADRFYIDCEFDGHNGPLLSMAIVADDGRGLHYQVRGAAASVKDAWVAENVLPIMGRHEATEGHMGTLNALGFALRRFIGECERPVIIADSPVDIGRFCQALSTGDDGGWASADYPQMTFEVHNVDCYPTDLPGAVQHNAWWDALALRHRIAATPAPATPEPDRLREALTEEQLREIVLPVIGACLLMYPNDPRLADPRIGVAAEVAKAVLKALGSAS